VPEPPTATPPASAAASVPLLTVRVAVTSLLPESGSAKLIPVRA
jgi:hypothetical protein